MKIQVVTEHSRLLDHVVGETPGDLVISIGKSKSQVNCLSDLPKDLLTNTLFTFLSYAPDLASLRQTCRRLNTLIEDTEKGRLARNALNKEPSSIRSWVVMAILFGFICSIPFNMFAVTISNSTTKVLNRYSLLNHTKVDDARAEIKQIQESLFEPSAAVIQGP